MVVTFAMMVAARVAVNDGAVEEHRHHLLHRKFWGTSVNANAQLAEQIDRPLTQSATKYVGAALFGQEPRHGTMLMFRCLQHL